MRKGVPQGYHGEGVPQGYHGEGVPQGYHEGSTTVLPWGGEYHRVTMGRGVPQGYHEGSTTGLPWGGSTTGLPRGGEYHRVAMGRGVPQGYHGEGSTTGLPLIGEYHRVTMGRRHHMVTMGRGTTGLPWGQGVPQGYHGGCTIGYGVPHGEVFLMLLLEVGKRKELLISDSCKNHGHFGWDNLIHVCNNSTLSGPQQIKERSYIYKSIQHAGCGEEELNAC